MARRPEPAGRRAGRGVACGARGGAHRAGPPRARAHAVGAARAARPGAARGARPGPGAAARRRSRSSAGSPTCATWGLEISGADLLAAGVPEGPAVGARSRRRFGASSTGSCQGASRSSRRALQLAGEQRSEAAGGHRHLHHPPGRRERGPVRVAQPRDPHRRRAGPRPREPPDRGRAGRGRRRADRHGLAGARHRHPRLDRHPAGPGLRAPGAGGAIWRSSTATSRATTGLGLLVLVADCFPVALSDGEQVAMLHCGWRPLAGGILEKALERFERAPAAAVGPGIGGCCYEVGEEVLEAFADVEDAASGRMLDLRTVISARLAAAGVTRRPARRPLHELRARPVLLPPPRQRRDRPPGGHHRARWILSASGATWRRCASGSAPRSRCSPP